MFQTTNTIQEHLREYDKELKSLKGPPHPEIPRQMSIHGMQLKHEWNTSSISNSTGTNGSSVDVPIHVPWDSL